MSDTHAALDSRQLGYLQLLLTGSLDTAIKMAGLVAILAPSSPLYQFKEEIQFHAGDSKGYASPTIAFEVWWKLELEAADKRFGRENVDQMLKKLNLRRNFK